MAEGAFEPNYEHEAACRELQALIAEEAAIDARDTTNPKDLQGEKKPAIHLVPPVAVTHMAKVMELGARKYGPYNWREKAVRSTVYVSAAMRHLAQYLDGEDLDPESGQPHVAHVAACMAILLDAIGLGNLIDDRPLPGPAPKVIRELTVE